MKKFASLGLAITAMLVAAAVAIAATSPLSVTGSASPSKAGTKKHPRKTKVKVGFKLPDSQKATLNTVTYSFPKTVKISGKGYPKCSADRLAAHKKCAKKSKVGSGTATALLGNFPLKFTFDIYVGGSKEITLKLVTKQLEGFVSYFPGKISGSKLKVSIPMSVQKPDGVTPSFVTGIQSTLSGKTITKGHGRKKHKYNFVSTTGCKHHKDKVGISLGLTDNGNPQPQNPIKGSTNIKCK